MSEVTCLYCGKRIPDDVARCPQCDAPSHYQERGYRLGARRHFVVWFVVLTVVVLFFAFYLPR